MRAHESPFTDSQVLSTNTDEVFKSVLSSGFLCRLKERGEIQEKIVSITVSTMSFNMICQGSKSLNIPQNNFLSRFKYISYGVKYFMQCFFFSFFFLRYHEQSTNTMSFPYIYLLGVTTLDITQLETREQV